jgi:Tfp pilus assembly protein PilV
MKTHTSRAQVRAYSLVEVIIAGFILVMAISGAALLAHSIMVQEESNFYMTRAINVQEQAAKLYALGLSPSTITNILPEQITTNSSPSVGSLSLVFTTNSTNISIVGTLETATCTMVYPMGVDGRGTALRRTNTINIVRPSLR